MTFSLDRIVSHVSIDEPNLISIHRSTSTIVPSDDNCLGHLCDAFICAARENNACRVYIALYDTRQKSNLVFVADPVADSKCHTLISQAETFLNVLGFSMEPMNVNYSPATREVILRDIKVMRPPKSVVQKRQPEECPPAQKDEETPQLQVIAAVEQAHRSDSADAGLEAVLTARLADATSALERLTAEKESLERKESREFKKLKAERDRLRKELDAAVTSKLDSERVPTPDEEECSRITAALEAEHDKLRGELAAQRAETEMLRRESLDTQAALVCENESLRQENERLCGDRDAAAVTLTNEIEALRTALATNGEEWARAIAKLEAERESLSCDLVAARKKTETARRKLAHTQAELDRENKALCREIDQLNSEREVATVSLANEIEALRAALSIADEALGVERVKNESALREMEALERNASAEMRTLKKEIDSLTAEMRLLESAAAEMKLKAKGEIERLQMVNQSQRRAAIKKVNALKEEMHQLAEARSMMESPFGRSMPRGGADEPSLFGFVPEQPPQPQEQTVMAATSFDPFRSTELNEGVNFEPDTALKGVPYAELGDVIEVHRSFNKIQAAPAGHPIQSCEGFVCLVQDGGQKMVYAAWLMNTTLEVLVCRPECIPASGNAARRTLQDGVDYFERVGFLMDRLELEADPDKRQRQIDMLPIFSRIVTGCAA